MSLSVGTRLGVYEVTEQIGVGGMGEVYQATDTNLKRQVAIKVLPATVAGDADRLARFQREAEVLAALNHPSIAAIYGLEKTPDFTALVMELVEGEDLSQRIARGAIPVDEALPIAKQIAEALEAAHEQGIIHRDLKPANIKVRSDGTVKVLDFGLAKAMEPAAGSSPRMSMSPTLSMHATQAGIILGTAAYMAPEQARGKTVDKRADIWAFGAVLFEMLTGSPPFPGDDTSHVLARVIEREPDWSALPPALPPTLGTYLRRCLAKDPRQRIRDIGDVQLALNGAFEPLIAPVAAVATAQSLLRRTLPLAVSVVVIAAIAGAVAWRLWPSPLPTTITRFPLALGEGQTFTNTGRQFLAISRDGTQIAYVANRQVYLRSMSETQARPIAGTEGSGGATNPVFSPDGRALAFYANADRALKRIATTGGVAVTICPADNPFGVSWEQDELFFAQGNGILRVSANGGKPNVIVAVKNGEVAHAPQMLPDGQSVLFTLQTGWGTDAFDTAHIVVQSLKSGERRTLVSGGSDGRYLPTGHLVYTLGGVVFAVRFDLRRLAVVGGPTPVLEGVSRPAGTRAAGGTQYGASETGTLVYVPGPVSASVAALDVVLRDRQGVLQPLKLPPAAYEHPQVSRDGTRLTVGTDDGKEATVWIYDLSGTSARRQLTFGGHNRFPIWSADGQHVAFQSDREGDRALFWQHADGTGTAERLTKPEQGTSHIPESWAPDGKTFLFSVAKGSSFSLWTYSLLEKKATPYGGIEASFPVSATFSPDGRWVAYTNAGVFIQPFPATGAKYRVASGGHPFWSADGHELFFTGRNQFRFTSIRTNPTFTFSSPQELPRLALNPGPSAERQVDITPDGKRFVVVMAADQVQPGAGSIPQIQVVEHWFEELKARVPTK